MYETDLVFPGGASHKQQAWQCSRCKRCGLSPWVGKIPCRRNSNPLQYPCLENPMDKGARRATVHGVAKSQTWPKQLYTHTRDRFSFFPQINGILFLVLKCVLVTQPCLALCNPKDCSPPGSSVHEILQTRILLWVAISFSRGSSQPRDQTRVSSTASRFFTIWAKVVLCKL